MAGFFENLEKDWERHWRGMPEFNQRDLMPYQTLNVHFRCAEDRDAFAELLQRRLTHKSKAIWWPNREQASNACRCWDSEESINPRYPVYIISKGRWKSRLTARALEKMRVPYKIVVEPQEHGEYAAVIDPEKILTLPFSNLGQGSIPARNWVWEHALKQGAKRHWILDDNINGFVRLHNNTRIPVQCGSIFRAAEEFTDRYENVAMAGFHYRFFIPADDGSRPPFYLNTRVYSCILIMNDLKHRWRGRYNEDTDLSLRVLKDGWCTVLFNAFLANKAGTMLMKGGNTDVLYKDDGRLKMAQSLEEQHPDVVTTSHKWGRWQHHVNYDRFARNKLVPKTALANLPKVDNFGMYMRQMGDRVVFIGQAPGPNGDASRPLEGKIAKKLSKLAKISLDEYLERTERINLLSDWPGKKGKGDEWDAALAKKRAEYLRPRLIGRRIIFLGRNVAGAFKHGELAWLKWKKCESLNADVAVIPHPSGIVQWWNEEENKKKASKFLKQALSADSDNK